MQPLLIETCLVSCLAVFSFLYLWSGIFQVSFHPDEIHKISETYYFSLILKGDWSNPDWHDDFYARTTPPAGKYIMGAWLNLSGYQINNIDLQEKFERLWQRPSELLKTVPVSLIVTGRLLSIIFGVVSCFFIYILGRWTGGLVTGVLAWVLLLFHPLFKEFSRRAMTDMILLAFMTMIVVISIAYIKHAASIPDSNDIRSKWWGPGSPWVGGTLLPGITIALATGTKLNGALSAFVFLIAVGGSLWMLTALNGPDQSGRKYWRRFSGPAVLGGLLAVIIFIGMNPYLYTKPVDKLINVLAVYTDWMQKQMISPGEPLFLWQQKVAALSYYQFFQPKHFFPWGKNSPYIAPGLVFFLIGMTVTIQRMIKALRHRCTPVSEYGLLVWLLVYGIGITAWIPVAWPRYFLPLCPVFTVFIALGLRSLFQYAGHLLDRYRPAAVDGKVGLDDPLGTQRKKVVRGLVAVGICILYYLFLPMGSLPPTVISEFGAKNLEKLYRSERNSRFLRPNSLFNFGDLLYLGKSYEEALKYYEQGLDLVEKNNWSKQYKEKILRVQLQRASIYSRLAKYPQAVRALAIHLRGLERIRDRLRSRDGKVLDEFDRLIRHRADFLQQLQEKAGK